MPPGGLPPKESVVDAAAIPAALSLAAELAKIAKESQQSGKELQTLEIINKILESRREMAKRLRIEIDAIELKPEQFGASYDSPINASRPKGGFILKGAKLSAHDRCYRTLTRISHSLRLLHKELIDLARCKGKANISRAAGANFKAKTDARSAVLESDATGRAVLKNLSDDLAWLQAQYDALG